MFELTEPENKDSCVKHLVAFHEEQAEICHALLSRLSMEGFDDQLRDVLLNAIQAHYSVVDTLKSRLTD